ncbi:MAG: aminodeoxychorismate synthase component I [Gammaproteobacteria bacterium]|nr:aminodeoxychorismate synthase component I [Gammaproteobacteria bacterium]
MTPRALLRDARSGRWLRYQDPVCVLTASTPGDVPELLETAERQARRDGLYAVGFVTYEAAPGLDAALEARPPGMLPPAWFALYRRRQAVAAPDEGPESPAELDWTADVNAAAYLSTIGRIREYIAAGDTYQVNFTYRLRAALQATDADPAQSLFATMTASQPAGYGALLETDAWAICSASPELFFTRRGRRLTCRPMKGTAPRGSTADDDEQRACWLKHSAKNRAENLMITDMVRNDLGRLADTGSIHTDGLFELEGYPTVWHLTSTIQGDSDASVADIFRALFPAASITGAPKRRTMEIIRELETSPRDVYTGAIGIIEPGGDVQFNVAIRTALLDKARATAQYGIGGGIVWDSDAADELAETRTKARILHPAGTPGRTPPGGDAERGFALLETLLWEPGCGYLLTEAHVGRLQDSARHFGYSIDRDHVRRHLAEVVRGLSPVPHRVRLLLAQDGAVDVTARPVAETPAPVRVALALCPAAVIDNPFVCHKTTHRQIYDDARRETLARIPGADDVLLVNANGEVTESTIANLVVDLDGELITPPLSSGLLPGVYRQHLLDTGRVVERVVQPRDLHAARALYLANSVRRLWPVTLIES